jgi:hypothetical protein
VRGIDKKVTPPLAIKTRIHTPVTPMFLLDPTRRSDLHLEVLVQNTSMTGLVFDKVLLEPVKGLLSSSATNSEIIKLQRLNQQSSSNETLFPDDTRQYLFTLSPDETYPVKEGESSTSSSTGTPRSVFPPSYTPGSILPLGRLDMAWFSAPYREAGRLQTSTLNRRVPPPVAPARPILPSRTTSTVPTPAGPSVMAPTLASTGPIDQDWEYDLVLLECERRVEMEQEFKVTVRIALRTRTKPAEAPRLALQYLSRERVTARATTQTQSQTQNAGPQPTFALSPPSRTSTPVSSRPFSPPTTASRPMTPVSTQLRQATSFNIAQTSFPLPSTTSLTTNEPSFPPPPCLTHAGPSRPKTPKGQIIHLGTSLTVLPVREVGKVAVNHGVTYDESAGVDERWEVTHELSLRFMALDEGLCELGGVRVLHLDGTVGVGGSVGRQWDSLGDLWVSS